MIEDEWKHTQPYGRRVLIVYVYLLVFYMCVVIWWTCESYVVLMYRHKDD